MDTYRLTLTFTQPLLGTVSLNKALYREYLASKASAPELATQEIATIEEQPERGTTGFHRLDGRPILYDYALKGFFKDACGMLRRVEGSHSAKLKSYRQIIDGLLFVKPRQIAIALAGEMDILERPLRTSGPMGDRVAIARSELVPAGSSMACTLEALGAVPEPNLREWLDYGQYRSRASSRESNLTLYAARWLKGVEPTTHTEMSPLSSVSRLVFPTERGNPAAPLHGGAQKQSLRLLFVERQCRLVLRREVRSCVHLRRDLLESDIHHGYRVQSTLLPGQAPQAVLGGWVVDIDQRDGLS